MEKEKHGVHLRAKFADAFRRIADTVTEQLVRNKRKFMKQICCEEITIKEDDRGRGKGERR